MPFNSVVALLLVFSATWAFAKDVSSARDAEISYLFSTLENSGCEFNRNGTWYAPAAASSHLHDKYNYLLKKGLVPTTEAFIDKAASTSSLSDKPYWVRCTGQVAVQSKLWFTAALAAYRHAR